MIVEARPVWIEIPPWAWKLPQIREVYGLLLDELTVAELWIESEHSVRQAHRRDTRPAHERVPALPRLRRVNPPPDDGLAIHRDTGRISVHRSACRCRGCRPVAAVGA